MEAIVNAILSLAPGARLETRPDGTWLYADAINVVEMARRLGSAEAQISTMTGIAVADGETDLVYHYHRGKEALNIKTRTQGNRITAITPVCPAAGWIEREIHDLYAVEFIGHPNLVPLIRPPEQPIGFFRQPGGAASKTAAKQDANPLTAQKP